MSQPARHLQAVEAEQANLIVVDADTGQRMGPLAEHTLPLQDQIDGLEREIRAWRARIASMKRDEAAKALSHTLFPKAKRAFEHWQIVCRHERSGFTSERFWIVEPFLENKKRYGLEIVLRAIDGAAFQSWVSRRSNGSLKVHNDWNKIFASGDAVEERANRAPRGWSLAVSEEMESWAMGELVAEAWGGLRPPNGWEPPAPETEAGQVGLQIEEE